MRHHRGYLNLIESICPRGGRQARRINRLALDSSERDDRHGALLDADMTADALILLERQLKRGDTGAPRSWTSS
jgi:hypothetical protein